MKQEEFTITPDTLNKKKISFFHNFQKHLIHTLKNNIKLKRIRNV